MAERNRIAREWHDTLLAGLSGIGWQLEATRHQLDAAPQRIPRLIEDARGMVDHVQSEARRIIWDLRDSDPSAGTVRLDDAVREYLEQIRRHAPFDGALETRGIWRKLEPDVELNALRVAQEAIANAAHHSGATHVSVTLEYAPRSLTVRIADDGSGFDPALARPGHFGITGMRERVLSFGGAFDLRSASGQGTVVEARFPLPVA
jgi:signal transduction histidine kinase